MRSKRRAVEAALFGMEEGTIRDIALAVGCIEQTARRHVADLFREGMVGFRAERGRHGHSWWEHVWFLTEKGSEVLGTLNLMREDCERMLLGGVPRAADDCGGPYTGLDPYITTGSQE